MVDFILFCFVVGVFAGGFWCGKTFSSFGSMIDSAVTKVKGWIA